MRVNVFSNLSPYPQKKKEELRKQWQEYREASPERRQELRTQRPEIFGTEDFGR